MAEEPKLFTSGLGKTKVNNESDEDKKTPEVEEKSEEPTEEPTKKAEPEEQKESKQSNNKKMILIVEDDTVIGNVLNLKLKSEGYHVDSATDGKEGLEFLTATTYDLVILDLIMPIMDGFEVLEAVNDQNIQAHIVVMSNLGQHEDIEKAKQLGAKDYLIKANTPLNKIVEYIKNELS